MKSKLLYLAYEFLYNCLFLLSQPRPPRISLHTPLNLSTSFLGFPELAYSLVPFYIENIVCYRNALFLFRATTIPSLPLCKLETDSSSRQSVLWVLRLVTDGTFVRNRRRHLCCAETPHAGMQALVS